jgi:glycogen phosphorylase
LLNIKESDIFMSNDVFFTESLGVHKELLKETFFEHLEYTLVKDKKSVTPEDTYKALAMAVRDKLVHNYLRTKNEYEKQGVKKVYYLSMEFLMGRLLGNTLMNLFEYKKSGEILEKLGYDLDVIRNLEPDMGLGNGGLGRLAACFLDSMATLQLPAYGYTLRYEHGIFKQKFVDGFQHEESDNWLEHGNPWEIQRPEFTYKIKFNGRLVRNKDERSSRKYKWVDADIVDAVAYDVLVPGYKNNTVNYLRLWQARSTKQFDFNFFNSGDYVKAVLQKNIAENISKVLYPNDNYTKGKILRLKQEYFLVAASLHDIVRQYKKDHGDMNKFNEKIAIQLNDTHPALAIPELMRILVDDEGLTWRKAWDITVKTFGYTNHTVLPEALETWSLSLLQKLLPRHVQIIFDINQDFLDRVKEVYPGNIDKMRKMSIITEGQVKSIRMANLAVIGSHSVNGVAALHSEIVKKDIFNNFYEMMPERFNNKTNGVTPRRWIKEANFPLFKLIASKIGYEYIKDLDLMSKIEDFIDDDDFLKKWIDIKLNNKMKLKKYVKEKYDLDLDEYSLFDVQVKRLHEYKRQLLNALHVITIYNRIKENPDNDYTPRTVIFSGKAAPGYYTAKLIIKLINSIGKKINNDPQVKDKLKVIYIENYSVTLAETIIPAADLSEQISTAGLEASGTGNMKFSLNGALTIGTMDGANVEMAEHIGKEHMFIFGLSVDEVKAKKAAGYNPRKYYNENKELKKVLDMIRTGYFNENDRDLFEPIYNSLVNGGDNYMLLADFEDYVKTQDKVSEQFKNQNEWAKETIINAARMGFFSSDRTIREYANDIWDVKPVEIKV